MVTRAPQVSKCVQRSATASGALSEAFEGWKKERERPEGTVHEYGRAIEMFIQLHGNLRVSEMRRSHARTCRPLVQDHPHGPELQHRLQR